MSGVDEILNYKKKAEDDYYATLGCSEDSTVSIVYYLFLFHIFCVVSCCLIQCFITCLTGGSNCSWI